jgi:3-deoxy-D-manno-octulosonic-acid transferase
MERRLIETTPITLRMYRGLSAAATPLAPLLLNYRLRRGKEHPQRMAERRGETRVPRPNGPLVWIHGASVGELTTVIPLIERIRRQTGVLVTTGTVTAAEIAANRLPADVIHQFVPLDAPAFVSRFLDHWRPDIAIFVESDLWPNMIMESNDRGIPLILVNGRLSERSFHRWRQVPGTIAGLLGRFSLCLVRTPEDAERYGILGAPKPITTGNLKLDVPPLPADTAAVDATRALIGHRPILAAASTHAGEETIVIDAHRLLRQSFPGLITLLAPRHPDRAGSIADIAAAAGLTVKLRSRGEEPDSATDIYLADTMGEMGLLYRIAPIVFIGGSLIPHGGQNPIEAAKLGAAILHGPHVGNFADIYAALDKAQGAATITDATRLSLRAGEWIGDPQARNRVAEAARATVQALSGALERTSSAIEPFLVKLRLEYRNANA